MVFFDAGGGHRSAANALCEVVRQQNRDWDVQLMNLQELLDGMDVLRRFTGIRSQDIYNLSLRKGWTLGSTYVLPVMHAMIRMYHSEQVKVLRRYWSGKRPDMVVSVIPNFNRALFEAMREALPGVPLVTILTDMADFPPHFWIEQQPQHLICGTNKALQQALAAGHDRSRVYLTSGMILNPKFYEPVEVDRIRGREALALDPDKPTALMMFGGEGSAKMLDIARRVNNSNLDVQIIAICGKNKELFEALQSMPRRIPLHVEGFTREVPKFMRLADFFIGKPGPGSISEAVALGLPVIVECNTWTLAQERYNAEWVEEQGVGIALRSFRKGIVDAVARMVDPVQRGRFKEFVARQKNRAVYEIPDILEKILGTSSN